MNQHTWKTIEDNSIVVDFNTCTDADSIHIVLRKAFGFPADYGENWSALHDYLDDFFLSQTRERTVHFWGTQSLSADLREYITVMFQVLDDIQKLHPHAVFRIRS